MFTKKHSLLLFCLITFFTAKAQVPTYAPLDGLQLWLGFNGSLTTADTISATINQINISPNTETGLAMDRLGAVSGAMLCDSPQDLITLNSNDNPDPFMGTANGLTVNIWYKVSDDTDSGILAQCYDVSNSNGGWRISWNRQNAEISFIEATYINGTIDTCSASAEVAGDYYGWHMVTFSVNSNGAQLYVDNQATPGTDWSTTLPIMPIGWSDPLSIGNSTISTSSTRFIGKIDDVAVWNRALTATEIDDLYSGETTIAGCTNSNSCTFNEGVTIDDGTCSFFCQGCMDPCACNYDQNAIAHIAESCVYDCIVDTVVLQAFLDLNINGVKDTDEEIIINRPIRYTGVDSATVYTNNLGEFILPVRAGNYAFEIYSFPTWIGTIANASTPLFQDALFPNAGTDTLKFGLAPAPTVDTSATSQIVSGNWDSYSCSSGYGSGLHVVNTGGTILSGLMTLTCDGVFTPGPDSSLTIGPDSISAGYAEWYIENLMPGESGLYTFHVDGNVSEASSLDFNMHIELNSPSVQGIYIDDFTITPAIDCSPQPAGEITATPIGIQPGNYIEAGETITYLVQFRNMGPGEVDSLRMSINLNSNEFELATLNILYASEALEGCLHDDGTIDLFLRDGYVIPDTLTDPIAALGYVVFEVQVNTDAAPGSTITVAPYLSMEETTIYVEPFVHRIFDCTDFYGLDDLLVDNPYYVVIDPLIETAIELSVCEDETNGLYALDYSWQIDNAEIGDSCAITIETTDSNIPDTLALTLIISNPALGCLPDTTTIPITIIIPVEEYDASHNIQAYPNPFENRCTVVFTEKFNTIVLYNSLGELIRSWNNQPSSIEIDHNQLSSGAYYLVAHSEQRTARKILIAE